MPHRQVKMGDAVLGLMAFGVLFLIAYAVVRTRMRATSPWQVTKHVRDDGTLEVNCERPGERPWPIGTLRSTDENRGLRMAELRSEAEEACAELNAGSLPRSGRRSRDMLT
jgi:hypothetical protein